MKIRNGSEALSRIVGACRARRLRRRRPAVAPVMRAAHGGNASAARTANRILSQHRRRRRQPDGGLSIRRIPRRDGGRNPIDKSHQVPAESRERLLGATSYEQASGKSLDTAINEMFDPSASPLPLIKGPGLDNQIVPSDNRLLSDRSTRRSATSAPTTTALTYAGYRLAERRAFA